MNAQPYDQKKKLLIFGGTGMVGSRLVQLLYSFYKLYAPPHSEIDLTNKYKVEKVIEKLKPNHIIYAAGLIDIEKAEVEKKEAFLLNAKVLEFITKKAKLLDSTVYYISTNAVFDGTSSKPYTEENIPNPISIYGKSKYTGEQIVLNSSRKNSIIRLVMVYSNVYKRRQSFAQKILVLLKRKEKVMGITDQFSNPTFVDDAVWGINEIIKSKKSGIFHIGSLNHMSNFEFAQKLALTFNFKKGNIVPTTFNEFFKNSIAKRPRHGILNVRKFTQIFNRDILHNIDQSLKLFKNQK